MLSNFHAWTLTNTNHGDIYFDIITIIQPFFWDFKFSILSEEANLFSCSIKVHYPYRTEAVFLDRNSM